MRSIQSLLILFLLAVMASSCATVAHGRFQQVPVNSRPAGAAIYADCGRGPERVGETPMVVKLQRKADRCIVTLKKEGFEDSTTIFTRHMSGWVWGNLFLDDAFLIGAVIDVADGAFYNRSPNSLTVWLHEDQRASR
jgi:hypothetical protein